MTGQLTERQEKALVDIATELRDVYGVECGVRPSIFDIVYRDEIRPGRGHEIHFAYGDGEHIAQGIMDPYGNGNWGVGEVNWIHATDADECACAPCVIDRS